MAWARLRTPVFANRWFMWLLIVVSLTQSAHSARGRCVTVGRVRESGVSIASRFVARTLGLPRPINTDVSVERDVRVPMDDGVALLADVYTPAGAGPHP